VESASRLFALPGCRVSPELVAAFAEVAGDAGAAEAAIARRCWQLLCGLEGTLLRDLALLARDALDSDSPELPYWQFMLTHYSRVRAAGLRARSKAGEWVAVVRTVVAFAIFSPGVTPAWQKRSELKPQDPLWVSRGRNVLPT